MKILLLNQQNEKNTIYGGTDFSLLKKHESGIPVKVICKELAFSDVTFYKWQSKYGSLGASYARRPKDLE